MTSSDRIPLISQRADVPQDSRDHYDAIVDSRGGVRGPFRVLLHSPEVAGRIGYLGAYIRFEGELPDATRETAILTTARAWDCAFEWAAHAPIAEEAGVDADVIELIAEEADLPALGEPERTIVGYARELIETNRVADDTYETAVEQLGMTGTVELTATTGYYSMIACVLNAFEVVPDPGTPSFE
ncbi:MAG: carboxymuconolactone decarboxylase family protein [Halobacteriales archaeon]